MISLLPHLISIISPDHDRCWSTFENIIQSSVVHCPPPRSWKHLQEVRNWDSRPYLCLVCSLRIGKPVKQKSITFLLYLSFVIQGENKFWKETIYVKKINLYNFHIVCEHKHIWDLKTAYVAILHKYYSNI